ncbi:hypothetical protein QJQ45_024234 [Haematococcus lacustris]|nr:hypothetical protein QJQ45_024234 [Haematococcus lacustris]
MKPRHLHSQAANVKVDICADAIDNICTAKARMCVSVQAAGNSRLQVAAGCKCAAVHEQQQQAAVHVLQCMSSRSSSNSKL